MSAAQWHHHEECLRQQDAYEYDEWAAMVARNNLKEHEMPLTVKEKGGGDFKKVPEGAHIAVCNLVADLGLQETPFGPKHKVYLRWEIPGERMEYEKDGQMVEGPMTIGTSMSASLSKKSTLRPFLEAWRGKPFTAEELEGFDVFKVLGAACQLQVIHEDKGEKTYANIKAIMALPKGMKPPRAENPLLKYSPDEPGDFDKLPEWLRKKIAEQIDETTAESAPSPIGNDFHDEPLPF